MCIKGIERSEYERYMFKEGSYNDKGVRESRICKKCKVN